jgi:hypothetical protein
MSVLIRRLELASTLHCGIPRWALTWQLLQETTLWVLGAAALAVPVVLFTAYGADADRGHIALLGLRGVLSGSCGALLGMLIASVTIRERRLFSLFKTR